MSLWNRCLDRLQQDLPTQQYSMWIRPLQVSESDSVLTLYAPNRFVLDWVAEKYRGKITELFDEFCGPDAPQLRLDVAQLNRTPVAQTSAPPQMNGHAAPPQQPVVVPAPLQPVVEQQVV